MKITIIYDNETQREDCTADWGFSCLVEVDTHKILFDTGAKSSILLDNMSKLGIEPAIITSVFISHSHWDHTGGLAEILKMNPVEIYIPSSYNNPPSGAKKVVKIKEPQKIFENIFSTGELDNIEQSLVVKTPKGAVVIVGCSHPGIDKILKAASRFGKIYALIGGFHGFDEFDVIKDAKIICATHCTQHKSEIKSIYPKRFVAGGVGKVIEI